MFTNLKKNYIESNLNFLFFFSYIRLILIFASIVFSQLSDIRNDDVSFGVGASVPTGYEHKKRKFQKNNKNQNKTRLRRTKGISTLSKITIHPSASVVFFTAPKFHLFGWRHRAHERNFLTMMDPGNLWYLFLIISRFSPKEATVKK